MADSSEPEAINAPVGFSVTSVPDSTKVAMTVMSEALIAPFLVYLPPAAAVSLGRALIAAGVRYN